MKWRTGIIAATFLASIGVTVCSAQNFHPTYKNLHGPWYVTCSEDNINGQHFCETTAAAIGPPLLGGDRLIIRIVRKSISASLQIFVRTPYVITAQQMIFRTDSLDPKAVDCTEKGSDLSRCSTFGAMDPTLIDEWKKGTTLIIRAHTFTGDAKDYRLDVSALGEALTDLASASQRFL